METMALFKLWICLAAIGCVLGTVSTLSIQAVPSASTAIIAIRVAHLELAGLVTELDERAMRDRYRI